jgi:hypothetical protein
MPRRGEITADASLEQAKKSSPAFRSLLRDTHGHHDASVREDDYKGHHIVIKTTYEIEIDGQPFQGTLDVSNAGTVHYHAIPNVSSDSAVELIRSVIDAFPDDFEGAHPGGHGGGHGHVHGRATSRTASKRQARKPSPRKQENRHAGSRKHSH